MGKYQGAMLPSTVPFSSMPTCPSSHKPRRLSHKPHRSRPTSAAPSSSVCSTHCDHSPSATLDLIILVLVLFACTFLVTSSLSHIFRSLSLLLPPLLHFLVTSFEDSPAPFYSFAFVIVLAAVIAVAVEIFYGGWGSRPRCGNPKCKGLKDALQFDVQVQTEESMRSPDAAWEEIEQLPWKGGGQGDNPDYECVRKELRRMAPTNGRAVLLFRARCGCPVAKLEGWGPKPGRRQKKMAFEDPVNPSPSGPTTCQHA